MTNINNLSSTDTIYAGDLLPVWRTNNGDTRKMSLTTLTNYLNTNLSISALFDPLISGTTPRLDFYETDAGADEKRTTLVMDAGSFNLQTRTDADGFGENVIRVLRSGTDGIEIQLNSKVSISPDANTLEQGLYIGSSSPTSGSTAGPHFFNQIEAVVRSTLTGTGLPGEPGSATWAGLQISVDAGGADFGGASVMGASFGVTQSLDDTSTADKNGCSSGVVIGATTLGNAYGGSTGATATADADLPAMFGHESDTFIFTGAVLPVRGGYNSWSGGEARASVIDGAYLISMSGAGGAAKWGDAIVLSDANGVTPFPLHTTASIVRSSTSGTIANGLKLDNVTFTDDLLHFPNFRVTAAGLVNGATIDELAWTTFTPTVTSSGGTITAYAAAGRYRRLFGRTIVASVRVTLTTVGTATGTMIFTLPVNAVASSVFSVVSGREVATTGKSIAGTIQSATTANAIGYDAVSIFAGGNGSIVDLTITYEAAA